MATKKSRSVEEQTTPTENTRKAGSGIAIEFEPRRGINPRSGSGDAVPADPEVLAKIGVALEAVVEAIRSQMTTLAPDEIQIEVGIAVEGKKKLLIVEGSLAGHLKVSATWKKKR